MNVCLQRPVFNASGAAVCCPQWLAARWAGRCAERRVAWPWRWSRAFICLSYCVCKTLNSVHVCLQCPVSNASGGSVPPPMACRTLGRAARRKARRLALVDVLSIYFSFVLCSQNVKVCACLLAMPSFQCVGGGSVPPPMACRTLV